MVCGPENGRSDLGRHHVFEESGPAARRARSRTPSLRRWWPRSARGLLSDEHFTVDGTLLEAWASHKSFRPEGRDPPPPDDPKNPTVNFHGAARRNDTHQSMTDPDARLYKKARRARSEARLSGASADRESPWLHRGYGGDRGERDGGARRRPLDARRLALTSPPPDRGGRQDLRHARLGGRCPRDAHHAARRPVDAVSLECD